MKVSFGYVCYGVGSGSQKLGDEFGWVEMGWERRREV